MTTIMLNMHNMGLFAMDVTILAMGICYGGIAQVRDDLLALKKHNSFGSTAFYLLQHVLVKRGGDSAVTRNGTGESA